MALVKIWWSETTEYSREIEIDGYDGNEDDLLDALTDLTDRTEGAEEGPDGTQIKIDEHVVTRLGDKPIEIKAAKPAYAEDF